MDEQKIKVTEEDVKILLGEDQLALYSAKKLIHALKAALSEYEKKNAKLEQENEILRKALESKEGACSTQSEPPVS